MTRTLAIVLAAAAMPAAEVQDFEWKGMLAPGSLVEIRGINGDVRAEPSITGDVQVVAKMASEETGANAVDVRLVRTEAGLTVCTVFPGENECRDAGNTAGPGGRVDYVVRVPEGVSFLGRTVNGGVEAKALKSDVQAFTVNGEVRISTTGSAQAETVNGSITASLLAPFWKKAPAFATVNGGIKVNLPAQAHTQLTAETKNGKIITAVAKLRGKQTEQTLEGTVGSGGCSGPLRIRAINGSIELKNSI